MQNPKISVILPSLNVGKYIEECLKSVMNQTLSDIEIICVDGGSTDGTREILEKYAGEDERISLCYTDVKSYGYQINLGLKKARGEYIGVVDTDDLISESMYQRLYDLASDTGKPDFVKCNHASFVNSPDGRNMTVGDLGVHQTMERIDLCTDRSIALGINSGFWAGIYRRQFLLDRNITFNETKGAAYQDTGFDKQVILLASSAAYMDEPLYYYRTDNAGSSVKNDALWHSVIDEWHFIEDKLSAQAIGDTILKICADLKIKTYYWNYDRLINPDIKRQFALEVAGELEEIVDDYAVYGSLSKTAKEAAGKILEGGKKIMKDIGGDQMERLKELIDELKSAILFWYPFEQDKDIVYIGKEDPIYGMLKERYPGHVKRADLSEKLQGQSDYIVCIRYAELLEDAPAFLTEIKSHLKPGGRLILGMNNRLGIKYFCGDRDLYTGRNFDGIEDYYKAYKTADDVFTGRSYDRQQLAEILESAGLSDNKFYSVFSDLDNAVFLFADGYLPNEKLSTRVMPLYNSPETVFLDEEQLYDELIRNGLFHKMANAYLIECSMDETHSDALQVTSSFERGHEDATITIIHDNDTVTKMAPFPEGQKRIEDLAANMAMLEKRGIPVVSGTLHDGIYAMPLIHGETGTVYFKKLLESGRELFLQRLDEFRDEIMKASEVTEGVYELPALKEASPEKKKKHYERKREPFELEPMLLMKDGFVDMIPLNSFFVDGKFVFFDQEFCLEDYPVTALMYRTIENIYEGVSPGNALISRQEIFSRYGIDTEDTEKFGYLCRVANRWLGNLRNDELLQAYYNEKRRDTNVVNSNRQRMNFSADGYQRIFMDVFDRADERKLILFGTGLFARRFLAMYGQDYPVYAAVDNNEAKWGKKLFPEGYDPEKSSGETQEGGVEIFSPELFDELSHGEYKVIICIKNYLSVVRQLESMGVREYSIYDPGKAYPRKRRPISAESAEALGHSTVPDKGGKKYHVGYIAGVFDLYHIGHLNMFRRAKEMCDYLIVGVVSDEGVRHIKRTEPFVPFDERIEMVRSCRYVDEAVEIPYMYGGSEDAFRMHHFDVQFSGSDYVNDPEFLGYRDFLEKNGATLEFFPYTESTSSTKLKDLIEKKLI